jgi:hypothetical protein
VLGNLQAALLLVFLNSHTNVHMQQQNSRRHTGNLPAADRSAYFCSPINLRIIHAGDHLQVSAIRKQSAHFGIEVCSVLIICPTTLQTEE